MGTTYGKTWWGEQWLCALKNIDFSNRLPRGASYARNGKVRQITFDGNTIKAKVQGSVPTPYSETIQLPKFSSKDIDKIIELIKAQPIVLSKLLNRQLDESIAKILDSAGIHLFPKEWSDLKMKCSCPDWAVPCKHLAAVIYKTSMEIDNDPFLVFSLHGLDLLAELSKRDITATSTEVVDVEDIKTIYDGPFTLIINTADVTPDYTTLHDLTLPLSNLLPASPAFYHDGDFRAIYQKELSYIAKSANKILQDKQPLAESPQQLTKYDRCFIDNLTPTLYQQLLDIDSDLLHHYHPTIVAMRRIVLCALHLIARGCIVPQIFSINKGQKSKKEASRNYVIIWQPAMIDETTHRIVSRLGQQHNVISAIITDLVHILAHGTKSNAYTGLFFNNTEHPFSNIGERSTPGGIRSWLDRYFMHASHQTTFQINETDSGFDVDVLVDNMPLYDIMTQESYSKERMGLMKHLAILCDIVGGMENYVNNKGQESMRYTMETFSTFLTEIIPVMRLLGVNIMLPKSLQQLVRPSISMRMKKQSSSDGKSYISLADLLNFDWRIAIGTEMLTPEEFNALTGNAKGLIRFKEQYIYVNDADMARLHKALSTPAKLKPGEMLQTALSGEYLGTPIEMTSELKEMIAQFTTFSDIPLPQNINAQLRPYQKSGYSWMYRNMKIGFGSIIADDMGLGKTLQVITLLQKIKEEGGLKKKKALVVVPTGLLTNWQTEVARFAPQLTTAIYHGSTRDMAEDGCSSADIILTTYGVARSDADMLKKKKWQILVIDEAQNIKNSNTAQSKAIHNIPADTYIAMSGTPVENRLSEFWSIIDFTNKGYLGTKKDFSERYATPIQKNGDQKVAARFRKVTAPFMLRRLKSDKSIISDLPDKIERNELATLTAEQAALYQETVVKSMAVIEGIEGDDSQTLFKRQGLILQMILALKQICNHPTQFLKDNRKDATLSGKSIMLLDMLQSIINANEKVLVFTQFREMGELLQQFIRENLDEEPLFYHGGCTLKQRKTMVDDFQSNSGSHIFILSLKAAGTGLNLTAATHVIHYDLWWNPAVEAQATDRAYRIGQHKNVQVHRFITQNTFEERIDNMIQDKKHLADMTVSSGENWIGKLSNEELHELFDRP